MASSGAGALNLRGADHGVSDDSSSQQHHYDDVSDALTTTTMDDDKAQWEDWDEGCDTMFVCLFCPESFHTRSETLSHCLSHGFDFNKIKREWDLDMFGVVKLINYIRHKVKDDETSDSWDSPSFSDLKSNHKLMDAERYLQPVLEDDPLLYEMDEGDDSDFDDDHEDEPKPTNVEDLLRKLDAAERRAQAAEHKAAQLEGVVGEYKALIDRLVAEKENADQNPPTTTSTTTTTTNETIPTPSTDKTVATTTTEMSKEEFEDAGVSQGYFSSYAHFGIHMSMLKDAVRTDSYRDAIYLNKHIFKDKVVLDIGCGTGILSMFAARSGAKKVIGIDRSDIVIKAQKIVKKNQLDDVVTIIRGEVEKVTLPVDKVDIIISEWMGYFLIYESMLDTVLFARDKWLQPGGLVQPSKVEMLMYAASMEEWHDVYGFDMECMRDSVLKEAQVDIVPNEEIISPPALMKTFDILQTKKEDQEFYSTFELQINQARDCHAFVGYFDTEFAWGNHANGQRVFFSTGSHATPTHWKQTVFLLEEPITELAVGDVIKVSLTCRRNTEYFRALHLWLEWTVVKGGVESAKKSQSFHLS